MTFTEAPAAPLNVDSLIRRQKPASADRKTLDAAVHEIDGILALIAKARPSANGHYAKLHHIADQAERELAANPTAANMEALHDAITRHRDAEASFQRIDAALSHAARVRIDSLRPIAERVLDSVEADLEAEGAKRRAEITEADSVFGETGDAAEFNRRMARTKTFLDDERLAIRQNGAALAWLAEKGLARNPYLTPTSEPGDELASDALELAKDMH